MGFISGLIVGFIIGGLFGVVLTAMCSAAKNNNND